MQNQHLLSIILLTLPLACTKPTKEVGNPSDDGPPSSGDEVGELPPLEPEAPSEPLPSGSCVTKEDLPYEGIRHQCGGSINLAITGDALGSPVDEEIFVDFGSFIPGDSYEHPRVAACCGEYDYEQLASAQPAYWRNCLYDAVQQFCGALPYYVWDMATAAENDDKFVVADQLNKIGNDLATAEKQYECIESLWAGGPVESFNLIIDHQWNPAYDVWVNIDILEVYDIWLPEDPADWIPCTSIYENDETVLPDVDPGPAWDVYGFDAGSLKLSGSQLEIKAIPDATSELLVGRDVDGEMMVGALHLHGGALSVSGITFERWRIGTLRAVSAHALADGSLAVPAGSLTFVGAVVLDGEAISVAASNTTALVLRESAQGWTLDPFSLMYTLQTGDVWALETSRLLFELH